MPSLTTWTAMSIARWRAESVSVVRSPASPAMMPVRFRISFVALSSDLATELFFQGLQRVLATAFDPARLGEPHQPRALDQRTRRQIGLRLRRGGPRARRGGGQVDGILAGEIVFHVDLRSLGR